MNKEKINFFIDMFAKLAAAIFIFSSMYVFAFNGTEAVLSVEYIWGILCLSFMLTLTFMLFFSGNEMKLKKYLICNIIYFILADAEVLGAGLFLGWFSLEHPKTIAAMEITFIVVFIVVWLVMYFTAKQSANEMNEQLRKIKGKNARNG